jgi:hypothetical protein
MFIVVGAPAHAYVFDCSFDFVVVSLHTSTCSFQLFEYCFVYVDFYF